MNFNRRTFLSLLFTARKPQSSSIQVAVIETFGLGQAAAATLVHQQDAGTRDLFGQWLRAHPKAAIRVRIANGFEARATIFRVRMCFGRGLILFDEPAPIREGDVLVIS
jgi:hypothetical protein